MGRQTRSHLAEMDAGDQAKFRSRADSLITVLPHPELEEMGVES